MDDAAAALAEQAALRHVQPEPASTPVTVSQSPGAHQTRMRVLWLVGLILIAGTVVAVRYFSHPPLSTQDSALRTDAAPAALPLPDKPSLIVLPFVNMSKDPDQEYFSDGLTEVLIRRSLQDFQPVCHRRIRSSLTKARRSRCKTLGSKMGVRYVLEGSVAESGPASAGLPGFSRYDRTSGDFTGGAQPPRAARHFCAPR